MWIKGFSVFVLVLFVILVDSAKVRQHSTFGKQGIKYLKGLGMSSGSGKKGTNSAGGGMWPSVFNLATKALISSNATCGRAGREEFCRIGPTAAKGRCSVCDDFSPDPGKRHPVSHAIDDGTNRWWQSPPLYYGPQFEYVTITLDLKQVYQVAYVIVKAANSPRPAAWILERSIDGGNYTAWQYFATSDKECADRYGIPARTGKPRYYTDSEVVCTTHYSKIMPLENGEIHTFLIHGRPGANETSPELLQFTKARYVRLRLQGLHRIETPAEDVARDKRLYYSIRDISVVGQCVCNGHAASCRHNVASGHPECECGHHTCGPNCDRCCPLFNQRQWGPGTSRDAGICTPCNCHGHAKSCHYDEDVDRNSLSLDTNGNYEGGGVCDNCTANTEGINCERCAPGYYRPIGTRADSDVPCVRCDCDANGSAGGCGMKEGVLKCECKEGYTGRRCDRCDDGYRGYPACEMCPCDSRGVLSDECEADCVCKANVDGKFCNHCKPGYFALQADNPDGCSACYCSGATSVCESAQLLPKAYQTGDGWLISDISVTELEEPTLDERNMISVGNFELSGIEAYYWLAPKLYLGNKLENYGSEIAFKVHWVVIRGDTSGKPTTGPNIIIVGENGLRIACGDSSYTGTNMSFNIKLTEYHNKWYHVPNDIKDIVTRLRRTEYKGDVVTRPQFLSVLSNIKHILLRAKFHTDQIEGSLEEAVMYSGNFKDGGYTAVEQCSCPSGYTGLSCEACQYGHVRIFSNTTAHEKVGYCVKCDCNGHSETCDPDTGECFCQHNTIGETCERCASGYYGNPLLGTSNDCKKCACPLEEEENNFSPSCQLDSSSLSNDDDEPGYVCTQCPKGYTGDHCEICDDGYFGVPSKLGGKCEPCSCGGGPCDRITGQCLGCRGNTEGWRCERCKAGFYGDPVMGCEACLCDPLGSTRTDCNNVTGECECKGHFIGRTCNKCELGYGNVTALCTSCTCNSIGSKSNVCDQHSGLCECQPGVEGFHCDACQHLHYGFSETGCQSCKCNKNGSEISTCDIVTGQCRCKPHYIGRTCHKCEDGYWDSPAGCMKCECDAEGSQTEVCDSITGDCSCKPGVVGRKCDGCKVGFYGFSKSGCKACEICNKGGHICDMDTGRCVCPPNSHGEKCNLCTPNSWGFEPNKGCKLCNCSDSGSIKSQCNLLTGMCLCQQGYSGYKCDQCEHGYYGYPKCRRCSCSYAGTDKDLGKCDNGICQCNTNGSCPCKANVSGKRCNHCKDGTFGLHQENLEGCTRCFCFGRSTICKEAGYTWGKIRAQNRTLSVEFIDDYNKQNRRVISNDILDLSNFEVIEGTAGDVSRTHDHFDIPLYWKLPDAFNGDRILSYGGYLRFQTETLGTNNPRHGAFKMYPLIWIEGNGIKLYFEPPSHLTNTYEVRIHESYWKCLDTLHNAVSRELLMVALQRISAVYIKATEYSRFEKVTLSSVSFDKAIEVPGSPPPLAMGVEKCECPHEYNGSSCQNPNIGYSRHRTDHPAIKSPIITNQVIDAVVGKSQRCQCNNRSSVCDIETGECLNCTENTSGKSCERCAEGYFGDPMQPNGKCASCACPTPAQNFAVSCSPNPKANYFICKCKEGYFGPTCDRCSPGYYGQPHLPGGSCKPCNCNKDGRINNECDQITGYCNCKLGITGPKCSQCQQARHVLENNKCIPCDTCIQILLDKIDVMTSELIKNTTHIQSGALHPPWETLNEYENRYTHIQDSYEDYLDGRDRLNAQIDENELRIFENDAEILNKIMATTNKNISGIAKLSEENANKAEKIGNELNKTNKDLKRLIDNLNEFGKSKINTHEALRKGERLIKSMREVFDEVETYHPKANNIAENCKKIYGEIKQIHESQNLTAVKAIKDKLYAFSERLFKLETILSEIKSTIHQQKLKNNKNMDDYSHVKDVLTLLERNQKEVQEKLKQEKTTVEETMKLLDGVERNHKMFLDVRAELDELNRKVESKADALDENIELLEHYKIEIDKHTKDLVKNVTDYKNSFNLSTKELNAVNASGRFKEIVRELNEANQTIQETKSDFNNFMATSISPDGVDSIFDNTSIATADSERLVTRLNNLEDQLNKIFKNRANKFNTLTKLESSNWVNGLENNKNMRTLDQMMENVTLNEDLYRKIDMYIKQAANQTESMRKVYKDAMNINISMQYGLVKDYKKYLNLTSSENIKHFQENIKVTKDLLQNVTKFGERTDIDIIKNMNEAVKNFKQKRDAIQLKLQELKDIVKKTRQSAAIIQVPMNGTSCSRSYRIPNLEPTIVTNIKVLFTSNGGDGSLFYIENENQYITLEVVNHVIQFRWKLSDDGDEGIIAAKEKVTNEKLIKVSIRRLQSDVSVKIDDDIIDKQTSPVPLDFTSANLLRVGYNGKRTVGLPGCVKDIKVEDHVVGLWEFIETEGDCVGCYRNTSIQEGARYKFKGDGYIVDTDTKKYNPQEFNIMLKMRTFDENALLFLVYAEGTYMAVVMRDRHLQCEVHYNNAEIEPIILRSKNIYNNGSEVLIDCSKVYQQPGHDLLQFKIANTENIDGSRNIHTSKSLLKVRRSTLYYGGVPPDFPIPSYRNMSFLGLMDKVSFKSQPLSLQNTHYSGVELTSVDDISYNNVVFDEPGYVIIDKSFESVTQIKFIVHTSATHGLLLKIEKERISFRLKNGKVVVEIDDKELLESEIAVDNGDFNLISLTKSGGHLTLFVNGAEQMKKSFVVKESNSQDFHYIYIGGVKGVENRFTGLIKDIILSVEGERLSSILEINKDSYVDSENAKIGRSKAAKIMFQTPKKRVNLITTHTENDSMKDMQQSDGCDKINYNLEPNAVKFGDAPNSYVLHTLKDSFWKLDYTIEFEFRTFYSDGLLLVSYGPKEHYTLVEIRDGFVQLHVKGKKNKKILIGSKIDDGNWHRIALHHTMKNKRKIAIFLDTDLRKVKVPQNRIGGKLFFGGVLKNELNIPRVVNEMNPFRGCIRSLKINNSPQGIINNKNTLHHNIGQCFPNIEKGSYFRGDSYAIYNNYFRLSNFLELSFSFRTSEQNGILLSISNIDNSPALSIELQNGAVVMSVDMGNGQVTNVTNKLSKYTICNNKWHQVRATFSTELTVNVDGVSQSWVLSDIGLLEQIEAPLYIGGLPDSAPGGTLKIRENFKGCINNLAIGNKIIDWIEMEELNNVSLNSCPVML